MKKKFTPSKEFTSTVVKTFAHCALALSLYASPLMVTAQLQLLKDVDRSEEPSINEYSLLTSAGKFMYFVSNGELWKSNGTTKYTVRMKAFESISNLTMSGETLYFTADDGKTGSELWKSNGSPATTLKVKDIGPGADGSFPANLTDVNGTLFFAATSEDKGTELWKSDGSAQGTILVKDISRGSGNPQHLVNYNGTLFFVATSPTGYELWKSDGTSANTVLVRDIIAGPKSSNPAELTVSNNQLFFVALHPQAGRELWISDGTTSGTRLLKDILPGSRTSDPDNLTFANGKLMFTANDGVHGDELWESNGTAMGTNMVKDMNPGPAGSNRTGPFGRPMSQFANVNDLLYFIAAKGPQEYIYRSDGTADGTVIVTKTTTGPQAEFTYRNGYVYFFNSIWGGEQYGLYKMPYTGRQISLVANLVTGYQSEYVGGDNEMIFLNGALFFPGKFEGNEERGYQLIRSDGTSEGTVSIHDTFRPTRSSNPREMISLGGRVYSLHYTYLSIEPYLYSTDGTPEGTVEIRPDRYHYEWEPVGEDLYFSEQVFVIVDEDNGAYRWQLSKTKGTPETTHIVTAGEPWDEETRPEGLTNVNGTLYYFNAVGELWKTDGTAAGSVMLRDFFKINTITNVNGQAFILTATESGDLQLWKSDIHELRLVTTLTSTSSETNALVDRTIAIQGVFYFLARGRFGDDLWRSDGTAPGTLKMFEAPRPGTNSRPDTKVLLKYNDQLYLSNADALFKVSGNSYMKVADVPAIINHIEFNNKLFLLTTAEDLRLYVSDGRPEGTVLLHQREVEFPYDYDLTVAGDHVYFNAPRSPALWRTDGTLCGTSQVDVGATAPHALEGLGNDLIFGGYKIETGHELYVYHNVNSIPGPACEEEMFVAAHDEETDQGEMLTAYPNPFADTFTLKVAQSGGARLSVAIYTPGGMPIERLDDIAGDAGSVSLGAGWPKGHYIIKVRMADRVDTYHVVKE